MASSVSHRWIFLAAAAFVFYSAVFVGNAAGAQERFSNGDGNCPGVCQPTSYACSGSYQSGLCPGSSSIQCCPESTPNCDGQCQINTLSCNGTYLTNKCPGGNDIQCCQYSTGGGGGGGIFGGGGGGGGGGGSYYGIDISSALTTSDFSCLKKDGYDFAIVRCYRSNGQVDTNAPSNIRNAYSAGFSRVDVYMFPCYDCGDPAGAVKDAVDYLKQNNVNYTAFWFDIEGTQYWSTNQANNQNWFETATSEAASLRQQIGVYTSSSQWDPIMGSTYKGGSKYPLWYAHYDNKASFSDFTSFAGWTSPALKQYSGDDTVCSSAIDKNWSDTMDF